MKVKLFLAYLRLKSLLPIIALLCIGVTLYNQFLNYRPKQRNSEQWRVINVISGDRFMASRGHQKLEVQICGIYAKSDESKKYLHSLLNKGNLVIDKVSEEDGRTTAEVFVQLKPDYKQEIHVNTVMITGKAATVFNFRNCRSAEYLVMAAMNNED